MPKGSFNPEISEPFTVAPAVVYSPLAQHALTQSLCRTPPYRPSRRAPFAARWAR
jgi:hypothetical protein